MTSTLISEHSLTSTELHKWNFEGKVAVVTGASRGIGSAIATALGAAGAAVAVNYSGSAEAAERTVRSIRENRGAAAAYCADVRDYAQVTAMMKRVATDLGRIDVLINNAGVLVRSFLLMMSTEQFRSVVDTNLVGSFHCMKAAALHMTKSRSGVIVNISSLAGRKGLAGQGAYAASKAAIDNLTRVAAKEFAKYGIRVNGVAPGCIDAGMMKGFSDETQASYTNQIALGRYGGADEVARAVLFLASDLSSYVTGETLVVDGGML
jgi:3-oxoacyl-[acyl-carrier protein] reductase